MSVFEALMFALAFATLVLTISNKNDKKYPQFKLSQFERLPFVPDLTEPPS